MSAVFSANGFHRLRLDRAVQVEGRTIAFFGVNPSTAGHTVNDPSVCKWIGFTMLNGGRRFILGNLFTWRSPDVRSLRYLQTEAHAFEENDAMLRQIAAEADMLVPSWGSMQKVPKALRYRADEVLELLRSTGKPIYHLGLCQDGNPRHPLMLPYSTELTLWTP
jgi:hypothetical protein